MKILMLGNSYTYFFDMPKILQGLFDANGVDAQVAESVHNYGAMFSGRGSSIASIVMNVLIKPIGYHWELEIDGQKQEGDYLLVSMCNGRYYGGGSTPVPEARMDDGVLHTVIIKKISKPTFAK